MTEPGIGYRFVKRAFDIAASAMMTAICLVPMVVIAAMIMVKDPGTPFYMHRRVGVHGKEISVLKFRTMRRGADTLEDMLTTLGDRSIVLARELTKKFEEYNRTTLSAALEQYRENPPRGEFVLIVAGADPEELKQRQSEDLPSAEESIRKYAEMGLRAKELTKRTAEELKLPKREVYELYLRLKDTL